MLRTPCTALREAAGSTGALTVARVRVVQATAAMQRQLDTAQALFAHALFILLVALPFLGP